MKLFNYLTLIILFGSMASCTKDDDTSDIIIEVDTNVNYAKVKVVSGGEAPFSYSWSNGSTSTLACDLEPGSYTVTVTDSKGKTASKSISVTGICPNPNPCNGLTTLEFGGYTYDLVEIGCQCWFAENLRNTGNVPNVTDDTDWALATGPAWSYHNNDVSTIDDYGILYNWHAGVSGNICPPGWHVPTNADFATLADYLCGTSIAGGRLKTTDLWNLPNEGATNSSGFNGKPSSYRSASGDFYNLGGTSYWWSVSEEDSDFGYSRALFSDATSFYKYSTNKESGFPVRCIKD